jgi:myo-inositol-1(or 4)-monophosphatase
MPRWPLGAGTPPPGLDKKGPRDLVTEADRLAEAEIVAAIREAFPDHAIVAEEAHREPPPRGAPCWYIDPLDGTTNFVHGLPLFAVSIACLGADGRGEAGCVYAPALGELFYAARGEGAFIVRGDAAPRRLAVTATATLADAALVTGFAYDGERYPNLDLWCRFMPESRALRRLGSAALDLAFVAAGRFDALWESGLNSFDVAAGALLVEEAGGRVTDYGLGGGWLDGRTIIATNAALHAAVHAEIAAARPEWRR